MYSLASLITLAQTTDVTTGVDPLMVNLTSLGSVVFVATLIVQRVIKPLTGRYPDTLGKLPTMAYLVPIACLLTYVANKYLFTLPGDNVFRLIRDTVVTIFMSQGFYTSPEALKPIKDTKSQGALLKKDDAPTVEQKGRTDMANERIEGQRISDQLDIETPSRKSPTTGPDAPFKKLGLLLLLPMLLFIGCATSSDAFYNGMASQWPPVRDTYNRLVTNDPTLSPIEKSIELDSARNIDRLLAAEAQRRAATQPSVAPAPAPTLVGH